MQQPINLKSPDRPVHVGVILLNSKTEILDVAPIDVFYAMSKDALKLCPPGFVTDKMQSEAIDIEFHWVNESGELANLTSGIHLKPTDTFDTCPPLDICLMGAHEFGYTMTENEKAYIRKSYEGCAAFLTICGGVLAALEAGILEGKTATGPRPFLPMLKQTNPEVKWVEKRWVRDEKFWTSGALLNGTDMMAAFATEMKGTGDDGLVEFSLRLGGWPRREVNYADVPWAL